MKYENKTRVYQLCTIIESAETQLHALRNKAGTIVINFTDGTYTSYSPKRIMDINDVVTGDHLAMYFLESLQRHCEERINKAKAELENL